MKTCRAARARSRRTFIVATAVAGSSACWLVGSSACWLVGSLATKLCLLSGEPCLFSTSFQINRWARHPRQAMISSDVSLIASAISNKSGAVHILRQPKSGVPGPPLPPPSAMVSIWLTPPPPLVSNGQLLAYPPSPPRQLSSAFTRRPCCTNIHYKMGDIHLLGSNLHVTWL